MTAGTDAREEPDRCLKRIERACIEHVLHEECDGRVLEASLHLGVAQKTVYNRLRAYRETGTHRITWPPWLVKAISTPVVGIDTTTELPGLSVLFAVTPHGWLAGVTPRPLTEVPRIGHRVCFAAVVGSKDALRYVFTCGAGVPWFFDNPDASGLRVVLRPGKLASYSQVRTFETFSVAASCLFDVVD